MIRIGLALLLWAWGSFAYAQTPTKICITTNGSNCVEITTSFPFPVTGGSGGISSPSNFGGRVALSIGSSSARIALPANIITYPAILLIPNQAQNDVYIAQGDNTVVASVTNTACTPINSGCSQNINVSPICIASNGFLDIAVISATGGGTLEIEQYTTCPVIGSPQSVAPRLQPYGVSGYVSISQWAGVAVLSGIGLSGGGAPRVTVSTDSKIQPTDTSGNIAAVQLANTPAPSTALALTVTQRQSDLPLIIDRCLNPYITKSTVPINISTATTTQLVAISGSTSIQVCSWSATISQVITTANTLLWVYGTGSSCGTGTVSLSGLYGAGGVVASAPLFVQGGEMAAPGGAALCITTAIGATGTFQGILTYVQS